MNGYFLFAALALAASLLSVSILAQPLGGVYTVANGNPGGAFDYGDIGDFFDDLEDFGVNAAVILELYDDGGPFISKESYQLGFDGDVLNAVLRPVAGISASNTLTIRAAPGEAPVVTGRGAASGLSASPNARGGMSFTDIAHTTIEGLEIVGGDFGIHWLNNGNPNGSDYIRVTNCRMHGIGPGSAIGILGWSEDVNNVTIENNFFWNCAGPGGGFASWGIVCGYGNGTGWVVRNNTIVHIKTSSDALHVFYHRGDPWSEFTGNIVHFDHYQSVEAFNANINPLYADYNVIYTAGQAVVSGFYPTWASWQAAGCDPNGSNTDPLFVSVAPGQTDPRLRPDSPAVDLIPSSALTSDVFGNPRPYGLGYDAGAHEVQNFGARADAPAGSVFSGGTYGPFDLTLDYGDVLTDALVELTDPEADFITVLSITPQTPTTGISAPGVPASGQPLLLEWTGAATDLPGTYTWAVEYADAGNGFALTSIVNITINPPPPIAITTLSLPVGIEGSAYDETIQTADATGAVTFTLQSGALPPGLMLDTGAGTISGTPTQDGLFTFTIQAADSFNQAAQSYDLTIYAAPPPTPPPSQSGTSSGTGGGGCTATVRTTPALLALLALLTARRRRRPQPRRDGDRTALLHSFLLLY